MVLGGGFLYAAGGLCDAFEQFAAELIAGGVLPLCPCLADCREGMPGPEGVDDRCLCGGSLLVELGVLVDLGAQDAGGSVGDLL